MCVCVCCRCNGSYYDVWFLLVILTLCLVCFVFVYYYTQHVHYIVNMYDSAEWDCCLYQNKRLFTVI